MTSSSLSSSVSTGSYLSTCAFTCISTMQSRNIELLWDSLQLPNGEAGGHFWWFCNSVKPVFGLFHKYCTGKNPIVPSIYNVNGVVTFIFGIEIHTDFCLITITLFLSSSMKHYSAPYFHGQSELMKFSNARPIYFVYLFITVKTAPYNQ